MLNRDVVGESFAVVVFRIERRVFALPLEIAERALPMVAVSPLPGAPPTVLGAINLHGVVVPVVDLRRRLSLACRVPGPDAHLLLARAGGRRVALPVDEVDGVQELARDAIAAADPLLEGTTGGIAATADGLLVLDDLEALLTADDERALAEVDP